MPNFLYICIKFEIEKSAAILHMHSKIRAGLIHLQLGEIEIIIPNCWPLLISLVVIVCVKIS